MRKNIINIAVSFLFVFIILFSCTSCASNKPGDSTDTVNPPSDGGNGETNVTPDGCDEGNHTEIYTVVENKVEGTCVVAETYDFVTYCKTCGTEIFRDKIIGKTADHIEGEQEISLISEASCNREGTELITVKCTRCDEILSSYTRTLALLAHTPGDKVRENESAATCNQEGYYYEAVYCTVCSYKISNEKIIIPLLGHVKCDIPTIENKISPTCKSEGYYFENYSCTECGKLLVSNKMDIPMLDHTPGSPVKENVKDPCNYQLATYCTLCKDELKREYIDYDTAEHSPGRQVKRILISPTCTEEGSEELTIYCADCDYVISRTLSTLPKIAHNAGNYKEEVIKSATCTNEGKKVINNYCFACDVLCGSQSVVIDALGHLPSGSYTENIIQVSCTANGSYDSVIYCNRCDAELSRETVSMNKLPHEYGIISCISCGEERACNDGISFVLNSDGKGYTVTSFEQCADEIIYLTTHNGLPITAISAMNSNKAKTVVIGRGVEVINAERFGDFDILLSDGNKSFKITDGLLCTADGRYIIRFLGGTDGSFVFDSSTPDFNPGAFSNSSRLTSVTVNGGIDRIWEGMFFGCSSLSEVAINVDLVSIESEAFAFCSSIEKIGVPFVGNIGSRAFSNCSSLKTVSLPGSYTTINDLVFEFCNSLYELVIPESVTDIYPTAFYGSTRPSVIYYMGKDYGVWSKINGYMALNSVAKIYYYSENKPLMTGDNWHFTDLMPVIWPPLSEGEGSKGLEYQINEDLKSYAVVGYGSFSGEELIIPQTYNDLPVTVIDIDGTFRNNYEIKRIVIPDSITSMSDSAYDLFSNFMVLESVTLSQNITDLPSSVFSGCQSLTTVIFGENSKLTVLDGFNKCISLKTIDIPDSVVTIGRSAFSGCKSLSEIRFGEDSNLEKIEGYAFSNCSSLANIRFPRSLVYIDENIFNGCTALTEVSFEDNSRLDTIGKNSFSGVKSLKKIDFGINSSLAVIGEYAFMECTALEEITFPDGLVSIESQAFYECDSLREIVIPVSVTTIGNDVFAGCDSLLSFSLASGNRLTEMCSLSDCSSLERVDFGDNSSITTIPGGTFSGCTSLKSVDFGENSKIQSIGGGAFRNCISLTSIYLPATVNSISMGAFDGCTALTDIYYGGSENAWKAAISGYTVAPYTTKIHYNSTK